MIVLEIPRTVVTVVVDTVLLSNNVVVLDNPRINLLRFVSIIVKVIGLTFFIVINTLLSEFIRK